ncbi:DNA Primase [Candidatus Thiomargarita nelsonii]|uniref:DNA Primase n=1 Tax=Candidatus Thiomargarita nelsonii TaxID=1003181 RepID=A0A176RVT4_9GAMM|nr:DNA Primase [Candidatus Thiomargarita nelsonii]
MAGRIPRTFIDDLITRVDIVDLIDNYVSLRKSGRNYTALCPFHNEKTPSFTVSSDKQFYYCFGCGAHGTAITFLMNYAHLNFPSHQNPHIRCQRQT